jgi:hypothetical protein
MYMKGICLASVISPWARGPIALSAPPLKENFTKHFQQTLRSVVTWVRGSYCDLAFLYVVGRHHHPYFSLTVTVAVTVLAVVTVEILVVVDMDVVVVVAVLVTVSVSVA